MSETKYTAILERNEHGWRATVEDLDLTCQSRTLFTTDSLVRDLIRARLAKDGTSKEFKLSLRYPRDLVPAIVAAGHASALFARARSDLEGAREGVAEAVLELKKHGLSLRDAAWLLDISHQRVQQILISGGE